MVALRVSQNRLEDDLHLLDVQPGYESDTPIRHVIALAYGVTQRNMLTAGTCVMPVSRIDVGDQGCQAK